MNATLRRQQIITLLEQSREPVSATALAARLTVSRQVIVGDIALLRAAGSPIAATPRGYVIARPVGITGQVVCCHSSGAMERELTGLVDLGCVVEDVSVEHPIYGHMIGQLQLSCRADVQAFLEKVREYSALPLSALTEGIHSHTLRCPDKATLEKARQLLRELSILQE